MKKRLIIGAIGAVLIYFLHPFLLAIPMILSPQYTGKRHDSTILQAHSSAVESFVKSEGFGTSRLRHKSLWNEGTVMVDDIRCNPWNIQLIGLTDEFGARYFDKSYEPPKKEDLLTAPSRKLAEEEQAAIEQIQNGLPISSRIEALPEDNELSGGNAFRLIAPIVARDKCLKCHDAVEGDLLGAFAYTLCPNS
jgi:hypothetical protein